MTQNPDERMVPDLQNRAGSVPPVCSDGRDVGFAAGFAVLSILTADAALYRGMNLGFAVCALALLAAVWAYSWKKGMRVTAFGLLCTACVAAGAGCFAVSADAAVRLCLLPVMGVLFAASFAQGTGAGRFDCGTFRIAAETVRMALVIPLQGMGRMLRALLYKKSGETVQRRRYGGVLLGAVCAVPALFVVVPLLMRSDAAFEGVMRKTVFVHAGEAFTAVLFGGILFLFLFSLVFSVRRGLTGEKPAAVRARTWGLDCGAVSAFLGVIAFFYVLYLLSQTAYFFSAFSGVLPEDFTAAAYARRGFFEMAALCAVNLLLTGLAVLLARRRPDGRLHPAVRALGTFICCFSVLLIATAAAKMILYVQAFGMTRLRVLTTLFMLLLAATFLCVLARLYAPRFAYMKVIVLTAALLLLAAGYADIDAVIARYNVDAYRTGALETVDVDALCALGDGATPQLARLLNDRDPAVRAQAGAELALRAQRFYDVSLENGTAVLTQRDTDGVWAYNAATEGARRQLDALRPELMPYFAELDGIE